jgi:3-deoxy-D-manno-octulosonic-acid transferase
VSLVLRAYGLMTGLAQPLLRRKIRRRSLQEPGYGEAIEERFGHYTQPAESSPELVWLHAVSLGETHAAAILLKALRQQQPGLRVLLTHGTATGRAEGAMLLRPGDVQVWQPWDSPAAVGRFLNHFKPRVGLLMETEVWPAAMALAKQRGVAMLLVNARMSDKSLKQALRLSWLSLPAYRALSAVFAQTADDARRFAQLGVSGGTSQVFGNLKFDALPSQPQLEQGRAWRQLLGRPVVTFASSREGEEDDFFCQISALVQVHRTASALKKEANDGGGGGGTGIMAAVEPVRFLVVPRHPQRFDDVAMLAARHGLRVSRRSGWPSSGPAASDDALAADVWLGDSLGEMALYYALSDVALLGGSFAPLGGQNLIEAAACACPIIMGRHTFNFSEAAHMAENAGTAQRVGSMQRGLQSALQIVSDRKAQGSRAEAGVAFAASNRGATEKTLAALQPWLASP